MTEMMHAYLYDQRVFTSLLTADQVAEQFPVKARRINELAKAGFAPCVVVDGETYLFFKRDIQKWIKDNLMTLQEGKPVEFHLNITSDNVAGLADIPEALIPIASRLKSVKDNTPMPCVYFLIASNEIVYVGQSSRLFTRLADHRGGKKFDRALYFYYPKSGILEIEAAFTRFLRPKYNLAEAQSALEENHISVLKSVGAYDERLAAKNSLPNDQAIPSGNCELV